MHFTLSIFWAIQIQYYVSVFNQMFANSNLVLSIDRTKESAISVLLLTFLLLPTSLVSSSIHQFPFVNLVLPKQIRDRLCVGLSNDLLKMRFSSRGNIVAPHSGHLLIFLSCHRTSNL